MKASEAKVLATSARASKNDMAELYKSIEAAANNGANFVYWYKNISALQSRTLDEDGYKVSSRPTRPGEGPFYEIRWD